MLFHRLVMIAALALVIIGMPAHAEDETGWSSTAELGLVITGGNSDTQTLSFKDETTRAWERSSLRFRAGAIRAETTTTIQTASGDPGVLDPPIDFTETNAEAYYFEGRYDKKITDRFFWFAGAGWDQNVPAGIDSRVTAFGGVGNIWRDDDKVKFRTDYALSYTDQEDVFTTAASVGSYAGLRASWTYRHQFNDSTQYLNDFIVDMNLDETDAWRGDMINAVAVALSSRLALKVSLQTLYNNAPPVDLITVVPVPTVGPLAIPLELDELDTIFSTSLVINF